MSVWRPWLTYQHNTREPRLIGWWRNELHELPRHCGLRTSTADIAGPGAICQTREQAEALAKLWRGLAQWLYCNGQALNVENVRIIVRRYGR